MLTLATLVLLIWVYLLFFHAGFWRIERFRLPQADLTISRRIAVLMPARNEADVIARAVSSMLRQTCAGEVRLFVVDDNSVDGTTNAARAAAAALGAAEKLQMIQGSQLPAKWTGKVWAMHQAWQAACEFCPDYVLLTDADIEHAPDTLIRLITHAERGAYDLVSLMVRLRCQTLAERFLIPAFVYFFLLLYPPARILDPRSTTAGAAGGCILIRPATLDAAGGLESIAGEIIDDCALASQTKRSGGRLWLGVTQQSRSIRGYQTFAGIRDMIARSAFNQLRHSGMLLSACIAGMLLTFVVPLVLVWTPARSAGWMAAAACIAMFVTYLPALRLCRVNPLSAVTLPFAAVFYIYATVYSAIRYWGGIGGVWKGRAQDRRTSQ